MIPLMTTPDTLAECQAYCERLKAEIRANRVMMAEAAKMLRQDAQFFADIAPHATDKMWAMSQQLERGAS